MEVVKVRIFCLLVVLGPMNARPKEWQSRNDAIVTCRKIMLVSISFLGTWVSLIFLVIPE